MKIFVAYLALNLIFAVAVIGLVTVAPWVRPFGRALRLHYAVLAGALIAPILTLCASGAEPFAPIVKVWSGHVPSRREIIAAPKGLVQVSDHRLPVAADDLFLFTFGLGICATAFGVFRLLRGGRRIHTILKGAHRLRAVGQVRVLVSAEVRVPFSYRSFRHAYVVLPEYLLVNHDSLRLAVAHELQHHRQRDTLWAYAFALVRAGCFFNPFVHYWVWWVGEIQEFACDEALAGRRSFEMQAYARCLVEVAETAWIHGSVPEGATGMILLNRGHLLNRRIQVMFRKSKSQSRYAAFAGFALIVAMMAGTAYAAKGLVQDRRVTLAQARELAAKASPRGSVFPVVVNEEVLVYLNKWIGTAEGRLRMRESLRRMQTYRVMVEAKIAAYNAPPELMAIPLIESGYQNLEEQNREGWGAGLWMFIVSTARHYGLTVDARKDERLNESLETDAAIRYLVANRARFNDWSLSVLAYNAGENAVQQEIFRTGSRDPWVLVRESALSREAKNYLPKLMAAIVIMRNPASVE